MEVVPLLTIITHSNAQVIINYPIANFVIVEKMKIQIMEMFATSTHVVKLQIPHSVQIMGPVLLKDWPMCAVVLTIELALTVQYVLNYMQWIKKWFVSQTIVSQLISRMSVLTTVNVHTWLINLLALVALVTLDYNVKIVAMVINVMVLHRAACWTIVLVRMALVQKEGNVFFYQISINANVPNSIRGNYATCVRKVTCPTMVIAQ